MNDFVNKKPFSNESTLEKLSSLDEALKEKGASNLWLQKYKCRFGAKLSINPELVPSFKQGLQLVLDRLNLTNDRIYNAEEIGYFLRKLWSGGMKDLFFCLYKCNRRTFYC